MYAVKLKAPEGHTSASALGLQFDVVDGMVSVPLQAAAALQELGYEAVPEEPVAVEAPTKPEEPAALEAPEPANVVEPARPAAVKNADKPALTPKK